MTQEPLFKPKTSIYNRHYELRRYEDDFNYQFLQRGSDKYRMVHELSLLEEERLKAKDTTYRYYLVEIKTIETLTK